MVDDRLTFEQYIEHNNKNGKPLFIHPLLIHPSVYGANMFKKLESCKTDKLRLDCEDIKCGKMLLRHICKNKYITELEISHSNPTYIDYDNFDLIANMKSLIKLTFVCTVYRSDISETNTLWMLKLRKLFTSFTKLDNIVIFISNIDIVQINKNIFLMKNIKRIILDYWIKTGDIIFMNAVNIRQNNDFIMSLNIIPVIERITFRTKIKQIISKYLSCFSYSKHKYPRVEITRPANRTEFMFDKIIYDSISNNKNKIINKSVHIDIVKYYINKFI
jgi:hypothetical protein